MAMTTRRIQNQIPTKLAWRMGGDGTLLRGNLPHVCLYLEKGAIWLLRDGWGQLWVSSLSTISRGGEAGHVLPQQCLTARRQEAWLLAVQ